MNSFLKLFIHQLYLFLYISAFLFTSSCTIQKSEKILSKIKISNYGAIGDGKHDDYFAFKKALNDLADGGTIILDDKPYYIGNILYLKNKSITIKSIKGNCTIISNNTLLDIEHENKLEFSQSSGFTKGSSSLKISNKSLIKKNDLIIIQSDEMFEEQDVLYKKEFSSIISDKENVKLKYPLEIDLKKGNIKISVFNPYSLTIEGINFQSLNALYILRAKYCSSINIVNCNFSTFDNRKFGLFPNRNDLGTSGIAILNSTDIKISDSSFNYLWYGVLCHSGCNNILMDNCTAFKSHHINNSALGTDNFFISNSVATECESGFDSHETSLTLTLKNCKDIRPQGPSRLRGRRDIAIECEFSGGLDLIYDTHSQNLFIKDNLFKNLNKCTVNGGVSNFQGHNIYLNDCEFNDAVVFSNNSGQITINNCKFIDKGKRLSNRFELLTVSDHAWSGQSYNFNIINSIFSGSWNENKSDNIYQMGIYLPMTGDCSGKIQNCSISYFERGLVLYGGLSSIPMYRNLELQGVTINNCNFGIFQQDFIKVLKKNDIKISNCFISNNYPEKLKEK